MELIKCNHIITEITAVIEAMPDTPLFNTTLKRDLVTLLVELRLKNEVIETVA